MDYLEKQEYEIVNEIYTTFLSRFLKYMTVLLKIKSLPHPHPSPERRRACLPSPIGGGIEGGGVLNPLLLSLTLTLLLAIPAAQAEELGRLFFTPAQRTQLNQHKSLPATTVTNTDAIVDASENEHSLTLNGIVQKDGGKRTVWVNGVARQTAVSDTSTSESVMVEIPDQNKSVRLKVGQRVLLSPPASTVTTKPSAEKPASSDDD